MRALYPSVKSFCLLVGAVVYGMGCTGTRPSNPDGGEPLSALRVVFHSPADNSSQVELNTALIVEFSRSMAPTLVSISTQPALSLSPLQWSSLDRVVETRPLTAWAPNTTYTVSVTGKDVSGESLTPFTFRFSTASALQDCAQVNCDAQVANRCDMGRCKCGNNNACGAGESCAKPPGFNDHQCFPNCPSPGTTMQNCGAACQACDTTVADRCEGGICSCGTSGACSPGQRCLSGQCVCDTTSCSGDTLKGCCDGNTCIPAAQQTVSKCRAGSSGLCEDFTQPYSRADSCQAGVAKCGNIPGCNSNSLCFSGACLAACSNSNCSNGCCQNGLCYTFNGSSSGGATTAQRCGTGGANCQAATNGNADTCNASGNLVCGNLATACTSTQNYCDNGNCTCQPGKTECGSGAYPDCCASGQWCSICSADGSGSCGDTSRDQETCDNGNTPGTYTSFQVP